MRAARRPRHRARPAVGAGARWSSRAAIARDDRDLTGAKKLERVADAHPLGAHHPVDRAPADLAGAHAVPESLGRGHHERGAVVLVERTAPDEVPARLLERDPASHHELGQVDLFLQPLDHLVWDAGTLPPQKNSSCRTCNPLLAYSAWLGWQGPQISPPLAPRTSQNGHGETGKVQPCPSGSGSRRFALSGACPKGTSRPMSAGRRADQPL